jgi:hypothetical protein
MSERLPVRERFSKLVRFEKTTDKIFFVGGAVLFAAGIPFGAMMAVYSGAQYALVDRYAKKNESVGK